jgi:hypothetical protein
MRKAQTSPRPWKQVLDSEPHFNVSGLTRSPEVDLIQGENPPREPVATISQSGETYALALERLVLRPWEQPVWDATGAPTQRPEWHGAAAAAP